MVGINFDKYCTQAKIPEYRSRDQIAFSKSLNDAVRNTIFYKLIESIHGNSSTKKTG